MNFFQSQQSLSMALQSLKPFQERIDYQKPFEDLFNPKKQTQQKAPFAGALFPIKRLTIGQYKQINTPISQEIIDKVQPSLSQDVYLKGQLIKSQDQYLMPQKLMPNPEIQEEQEFEEEKASYEK